MIIGVTGLYASGKDTVAEYLMKKGFQHYSLSDEIREEAKIQGIKLTRENLIKLGNELREKYGAQVLAEKVKLKLRENEDYVITSFRNPAEVESFLSENNFILISVFAKNEKRFELLKQRAREEDPQSFKKFLETEKIEQSSDPSKQQLHKVEKMAKIVVNNDGSLGELYDKVNHLLFDLKKRFNQFPSWDQYFINICKKVKERSRDPSTQTGCVIVDEDNRPISFGYNGFVAGADESKLTWERPMKYHFSIHAEMNALIFSRRDLSNCKLYSIYFPCENCLKHILQAGIKEIVYEFPFIESKKNQLKNSMSNDDTTMAVTRMLLAMPQIKTKNIHNGKNYVQDVFGGIKNVPKF